MKLIDREALKAKLDRGEDIKLIMTLGEWAYRAKHIPGSLHFTTPEEALAMLRPEDEIVVYCSHDDCIASKAAYQILERHGFQHLHRFAGGLQAWEDAGYPLEGDMVAADTTNRG
jgi:rhodanese-related sulfurtransferase